MQQTAGTLRDFKHFSRFWQDSVFGRVSPSRRQREPFDGTKNAGSSSLLWNGKNEAGRIVNSFVCVPRIEAENVAAVKNGGGKIILHAQQCRQRRSEFPLDLR